MKNRTAKSKKFTINGDPTYCWVVLPGAAAFAPRNCPRSAVVAARRAIAAILEMVMQAHADCFASDPDCAGMNALRQAAANIREGIVPLPGLTAKKGQKP